MQSVWLPLRLCSHDQGILVNMYCACVCVLHTPAKSCIQCPEPGISRWRKMLSFQRAQWKSQIEYILQCIWVDLLYGIVFACLWGFFSSIRKVLLFFFLSFFLLWQLQWIMYKNLEAWDHCLNTVRGPLSYFCVRCLALKWSFYHFMGISDRSACLDRCLLDKTFLCHFKDIFCLCFPCSKFFPGWEI